MPEDLDIRRFEHETRLSWFKAWSPVVLTMVTGVSAYLTVDLHTQRMEEQRLKLEEARFAHEAQMEARTFERDTNLGFIAQFLEQDDEVKRLALIDFIHQTTPDEGLRGWAATQKRAVAQEVAELRKALAEAEAAQTEALAAQLAQLEREREAEAALEAAQAQAAAAELASKAERQALRARAEQAHVSARRKHEAAETARTVAETAAAKAEVATGEAELTEARVRGRGARQPRPLRAPLEPPALMDAIPLTASPPAPATDKVAKDAVSRWPTFTCRCGLRRRKVVAPDRGAATTLCAAAGPLCRLK